MLSAEITLLTNNNGVRTSGSLILCSHGIRISELANRKRHEEPYELRDSRPVVRPDKAGVFQQELVLSGEEPGSL